MAAGRRSWEIAKARNRMLAAPESSDKDDNMAQKPKQKSSQHRYIGALAVPLKPRPKRRLPYAWRRSRTLRAQASGAAAPPVYPISLNSIPGLNWGIDLKSLIPLDSLGAGANTSVAPALPIFPDSLYSAPGWRWEFIPKFPLLFDHYGIAKDDPDALPRLCLGMAIAHVPGFQVKASRAKGRPRTVPPSEEEKFYARFCVLRQGGQSDRNAARLLANELRKSGRAVGSDASILRRMQRLKLKFKTAGHAI